MTVPDDIGLCFEIPIVSARRFALSRQAESAFLNRNAGRDQLSSVHLCARFDFQSRFGRLRRGVMTAALHNDACVASAPKLQEVVRRMLPAYVQKVRSPRLDAQLSAPGGTRWSTGKLVCWAAPPLRRVGGASKAARVQAMGRQPTFAPRQWICGAGRQSHHQGNGIDPASPRSLRKNGG